MAIPFAFPSDEDTEANYQRLDQLLSDLFDVLQQILLTQRRIRDAQPQPAHIAHRVRNGQSSNFRRSDDSSDPPLTYPPPVPPSLFSGSESRVPTNFLSALQPASTSSTSTTSSTVDASAMPTNVDLLRFETSVDQGRNPTRRRRRRRRISSESSCCEEAKNNTVLDVVAPMQSATQDWTQEEPQPSEDSKRRCRVETNPADASLLSMFVPPPFGSSIWTAVIFVVGWRLLTRVR